MMTYINQTETTSNYKQRYVLPIYLLVIFFIISNGLASDFFLWQNSLEPLAISPVVLLSFLVAGILMYKGEKLSTPYYLLASLVFLLPTLIPSSLVAWFCLLCLAISGIYFSTENAQKAHYLLLALSLAYIWKSTGIKLASATILEFETLIIFQLISAFFKDASVTGNIIFINQSYSLAIGIGCSALSNLSIVLLGWLSFHWLSSETAPRYKQIVTIIAMVIILNSLRITLMAVNKEWYYFIHEAEGAEIYDLLLSLLLISGLKVKGSKKCIG
ncbi:MAG: exosortase/archaeosortase family protein [Moritella sp.]|jgi:exosortase/archaeosortase family protein